MKKGDNRKKQLKIITKLKLCFIRVNYTTNCELNSSRSGFDIHAWKHTVMLVYSPK